MKETVYKNYLITVLLVALAFSGMDRLLLALLSQDIKADLALSDTQLGLLTGAAFAVFYAIMGVPMARWADRGNRVLVISIATALWSVAVILCGAAGSFVQLLVIRICVAVGEAGCLPVANSLIADSFTRSERPRAAARFALGLPVAGVIAYLLGGWVNQYFGWRTTFMVLGAPGVVLAAMAWLTLREPRHSRSEAVAAPADPVPGFLGVCGTLWKVRTFRHLLIGNAVVMFAQAGAMQWLPTFFIRTHALGTGALGSWLGLIYPLGTSLGTLLGSELAVRYASNNESLQLKGQAITYLAAGILYTLVYLSPNPYVALCLAGLAMLSLTLSTGSYFALIQTLVPKRMCAQAIAFLFLTNYLVGVSLGPVVVGALSDLMHAWAGNESLRYVLITLFPIYVWSASHVWYAGRTVAADLQAAGVMGATDHDGGTSPKSSNVVLQRAQQTPVG